MSSIVRIVGDTWWISKTMKNKRQQYPKQILVGNLGKEHVYLPQKKCERVLDIMSDYLKSNGYDGLYNRVGCGCGLGELMPCCENNCKNCEPAYRFDCERCRKFGSCDLNDDFEIMFSPNRHFCEPDYREEDHE